MVQLKGLDEDQLFMSSELVNQKTYSQYFTPIGIARFMAKSLELGTASTVRLLDPGAGLGTLTVAVTERLLNEKLNLPVHLTLVEVDSILSRKIYKDTPFFFDKQYKVITDDFIKWGVSQVVASSKSLITPARFTHIILNPPYQKLLSTSQNRRLLSSIGIEVSNLYAAFVALSLRLLEDEGDLVAIIPRSFCNGLYYKAFREFLFKNAAIMKIHLFESRTSAFRKDDVLQENIIIHLKKNVKQGDVLISTSKDDNFHDYEENIFPYNQIIKSTDPESFIRIPSSEKVESSEYYAHFVCSLKELGLEISTGPIVNFRVDNYLRENAKKSTVPLFHPQHIQDGQLNYRRKMKKLCYIKRAESTESLFYPAGYYVVMRRRTSKEEPRRFVTAVLDPANVTTNAVGFENGLNVIHSNRKGLDCDSAYGLHAYFQLKQVEAYFRTFNGHTQVNVTDVRNMKFPNLSVLKQLGKAYYQAVEIKNIEFDVESWFNRNFSKKR